MTRLQELLTGELREEYQDRYPVLEEGKRWDPFAPITPPVRTFKVKDPYGPVWLDLSEDGSSAVLVTWGSQAYYDKWLITPEGEAKYLGSVDGPRYPPLWVSRAIAKAREEGAI